MGHCSIFPLYLASLALMSSPPSGGITHLLSRRKIHIVASFKKKNLLQHNKELLANEHNISVLNVHPEAPATL